MAQIIKLEGKPSKGKHATGVVICLDCMNEWTVVSDLGADPFECPKCHMSKGVYKYPFVPTDEIWFCNCGNDLFHITPNGNFCPKCGNIQVLGV